jgi:hypothetical protein
MNKITTPIISVIADNSKSHLAFINATIYARVVPKSKGECRSHAPLLVFANILMETNNAGKNASPYKTWYANLIFPNLPKNPRLHSSSLF